MSPTRPIKLSDILLDRGTQARATLNAEAVGQYAEAMQSGAKFPPVVVFCVDGDYLLADGFHRIAAAIKIGRKEFVAEILKGSLQDALWYALGANRENSTLMKPEDKRHAILRALETWPERPTDAIGEQIGCSGGYVRQIRDQVVTTYKLPSTVVGRARPCAPSWRDPCQCRPIRAWAVPV